MHRQRVYLDTSVISAYFDDRAPERREMTREFWHERLSSFEPFVSDVVDQEIEETPDSVRRAGMIKLVRDLPRLTLGEPAELLAREYLNRGIFRAKHLADGLHVAIAVIGGLPNLVSWNYKHLVRLGTRREVNLVNLISGWGVIEILAPPEL